MFLFLGKLFIRGWPIEVVNFLSKEYCEHASHSATQNVVGANYSASQTVVRATFSVVHAYYSASQTVVRVSLVFLIKCLRSI